MSTPFKAYCHLTLAMIIVGSSVAAGKLMIATLPLYLASAMRFALACLILFPLLKIKEGGLPQLRKKSWLTLFLQALFGSFLFNVLLLYGLQYTSASVAGIITSTTPACMGLIAWIVLKSRLNIRSSLGIAFSMAGILIINIINTEQATPSHTEQYAGIIGNGLVFLAVVCESLFLLLRKAVPETISSLAMATIMSLFGLLLFSPMAIYEAFSFSFSNIRAFDWMIVVYYGVVITVLAYLFWFQGIVSVAASVAGIFTGIMPVSALLISSLVLGEKITLTHGMGCVCVLLGILCISNVGLRLQGPWRIKLRSY